MPSCTASQLLRLSNADLHKGIAKLPGMHKLRNIYRES